MRVSTIAELNSGEDGAQPEAVKAKLKGLAQPRSGEKNGKPWHFQDAELIDATGSITCVFSQRDPIDSSWVGEILYFESSKNSRGLSGLYIKDRVVTSKGSDGETVREFKVTPTAEVTLAGTGEQNPEPEQKDDVPYAEDEKPKAKAQPAPNGKPAIGARAKEVYYERTSNLGNYESMKVGILLELEPGAKFQDCLDVAKTMVEKNLKPEGITAARKGPP